MAQLNLKTSKPAQPYKITRPNYVVRAPTCLRCGDECKCSEEEIEAGGPAFSSPSYSSPSTAWA